MPRSARRSVQAVVDLAPQQSLPRRCPACGASGLEARAGAERAVVACSRCGGSWAVELGYLVPLGPATVLESLDQAPVSHAGGGS